MQVQTGTQKNALLTRAFSFVSPLRNAETASMSCECLHPSEDERNWQPRLDNQGSNPNRSQKLFAKLACGALVAELFTQKLGQLAQGFFDLIGLPNDRALDDSRKLGSLFRGA